MQQIKKAIANLPRPLHYLFIFKIGALIAACFAPFVHPHIIRQSDTMGVAYRYWMRWTMEQDLHYPLLPAVLNAGDTYGISPMEVPFLNIFAAPFFAFGISSGRILSSLAVLVLFLALTYINFRAWKDVKLFGVSAGLVSLMGILFGVSQKYVGRFMPDYLSYILVSISIAISWKKPRYVLSFILACIGLLIKPPSVIAFGIVLVKPIKEVLRNYIPFILPAFISAVLYFTLGIKKIKEVSDITDYFRVAFRPPLESLISFLKQPKEILELASYSLFSGLSLFLILVLLRNKEHRKVVGKLLGLMILQVIAGAAIDGDHAFIHDYYFIGTSFVSSLLFLYFLKHGGKKLTTISIALLWIVQVERAAYEIQPLFKNHIWRQCDEILENKFVGDSLKINTPMRSSVFEGLCMGKIQNSKTAKNRVEIENGEVKHLYISGESESGEGGM